MLYFHLAALDKEVQAADPSAYGFASSGASAARLARSRSTRNHS